MKKINLKSGAMAAVLAGTMALSMVPATAFADEATTPENYGTTQTIEKTYNYGNTPLAAQNFTFSLSYKSASKIGSNEYQAPTLKDDQDGKVTISTPGTDNTPDDKTVSGSAKLIDLVNEYNFTKPGSYTFELSEDPTGNPNIADSTAKYTVRVDVVWNTNEDGTPNGTVKINGIGLFKSGEKTKEVKADFTNNSNAASGALTVSKKVSGTAANTGDYFKYTLELTDAKQVAGSYAVKKGDDTVATLDADNDYSVSFYLKDGESVSVSGLPKGAAYKVTESEKVVNVNGDTMSEGTEDNGYTETNTVDGTASKNGLEATGTVSDAGDTVAYNNEKGFIPHTGVTMNMLPGIGIAVVAVAGGATLVISRRKRAGQDF